MIGLTIAHVGGIPIEETLGSLGPVALLAAGAASAMLSARIRHLRARWQRRGADKCEPSSVKEPRTAAAGEPDSQPHQ